MSATMDSQPYWAGVALLFRDGRMLTWQLNDPIARISVEHKFHRYSASDGWYTAVPDSTSTIDIELRGDASYWKTDAHTDKLRRLYLPSGIQAIEGGQHVLPSGD